MEVGRSFDYLAWWSGGITSAVACKMAVESGSAFLAFIDTGAHHPDTARFFLDCQNWYGQPIHIFTNKRYENPIDVVLTERFINSPKGAKCTQELKRLVGRQIQRMHVFRSQVFGFEYSPAEINRARKAKKREYAVSPLFPLIKKHITKNNAAAIIETAGIALPEMYNLGFGHNNCIGCVKGGKGYWNRIRELFPKTFEEMKAAEAEIGRSCIKGTFLRDLLPGDGRDESLVVPECGTFCDNVNDLTE